MKYLTTILLCLGVSRSGWAQTYPSCGYPQTSLQIVSPPSCCGNNGNGISQCGDLFALSAGCGCANSYSNFGSGGLGCPCSQPVPCCCSPIVSIPQPISSCCSGQNIQPISSCCSAPAIQPASSCCCGPAIQPINPCCLPAVPITPCCSTPAVSSIGSNCGGSCSPLNCQSFAQALYQMVLGCPYLNNYILQCNCPSGCQSGSNSGSCGPAPPCGCGCAGPCSPTNSPYYYASLCQLVLGCPYLRNLIQCNCPGGNEGGPNSEYPSSKKCGNPGPCFPFPAGPICDPCSYGFQIPAICPYNCKPEGRKFEPYTDGMLKISDAESVSQKINTEGKKSQRFTGSLSAQGNENTSSRRMQNPNEKRRSTTEYPL